MFEQTQQKRHLKDIPFILEAFMVYFFFVGNCPMLTTDDYIDWKPCTKILETSCPNSSFVSNEVYKCKSLSLSLSLF